MTCNLKHPMGLRHPVASEDCGTSQQMIIQTHILVYTTSHTLSESHSSLSLTHTHAHTHVRTRTHTHTHTDKQRQRLKNAGLLEEDIMENTELVVQILRANEGLDVEALRTFQVFYIYI